MASKNIDYNRGVLKKVHNKLGVDVYMYKDTPGVYLNAYGTEVSEALAAEAGFDIETLGRARLKRERMAQAMAAIEQELNPEVGAGERKLVEERGGFKIMDIGLGRHIVEDPDGNKLTAAPLPLETAKVLLERLTPNEPVKPKQQPPVIWTKKEEAEEPEEPEKPKVSTKKSK